MPDPVPQLIRDAFEAVVEAEKYVWAGGPSPLKPDLLEAHSALLRLRNAVANDD